VSSSLRACVPGQVWWQAACNRRGRTAPRRLPRETLPTPPPPPPHPPPPRPPPKGSSSRCATPTTPTPRSAPRPSATRPTRRWALWGQGGVASHPPRAAARHGLAPARPRSPAASTSSPHADASRRPRHLPTHPPRPRCPPQVVVPHRPDVKLEGAGASLRYVIVNERADATTRVVVHRLAPGGGAPAGPLGEGEVMKFEEAVYSLSGGGGRGCWGGGYGGAGVAGGGCRQAPGCRRMCAGAREIIQAPPRPRSPPDPHALPCRLPLCLPKKASQGSLTPTCCGCTTTASPRRTP
jgi:hypothetical protein